MSQRDNERGPQVVPPVPDSLPVDDDAGEMVDGKRHGYGTMVWPDGKKYVGEWKGGNRHGCGLVSWPDGQKYIGEWDGDLATGKAVLRKADGSLYIGDLVDSQRQGHGIQTFFRFSLDGEK